MGFMGIDSIGASDNAADFMSELSDQIKAKIIAQIPNYDNEYNTPGYIDVALVLKSLISEDNEFYFTYEWEKDVWKPLSELFEKNKDWDIDNYKELHEFVDEMLKKSQEY